MSSKRNVKQVSSSAATAGALQDHLLHELAIGDLSLCSPLKSYSDLKKKLKDDERRRRTALKNVKPTVNTGRIKKTCTKLETIDPEKEYVLDPLPKPSLAQRMGLVPQFDKPLSNEEWTSVKQKSIARDDFKNPCAICQEHFRTEDQVLLSCSHVFHKACIRAFERFTGKKTCPMCRKIQYQARVVHDGTKEYKTRAATRIQSVWRGYVVRKWYVKLRQTIPPKDPRLRKKFYEDKLHEITDRMVAMTNGESVDRFLQDIDQSIASSRKIFQHFEDSCVCRLSDDDWVDIEIKALKREDKDCPICLRDLVNQDPAGEVNEKPKIEMGKHSKEYKHCNARSLPTKTESSTLVTKPFLALLSCSHLFHAKCLEALEEFYVMDNPVGFENSHHGMSPLEIPQPFFHCPMCRSLYVKKII